MDPYSTTAPTTLEQALGQQANSQIASMQDNYAQNRKKLISQQAASGRLMSGVKNYPLTDLATGEAGNEAGVYSNLSSALGSIPLEDWENQQQYNRNLSLAQLIGSMNKPSTLQEVLGGVQGGIGAAGSIASLAALL